jgi:hypothetical protein
MRVVVAALAVVLVGCTSDDTTCNHTSDGSYPEEGYCIRLDVAAGTGFDKIELLFGGPGAEAPDTWTSTAVAPTTPALIETGEGAPTSFDVVPLIDDDPYVRGDETVDQTQLGTFAPSSGLATTFTYEGWQLYEWDSVVVVGFTDGAISGAAYASFATSFDVSLELATGTDVETWGLPGAWVGTGGDANSWGSGGCARITDASSGITHYVLRAGDYDCDGVEDSMDCQPAAYCDPTDTSAASVAACACS